MRAIADPGVSLIRWGISFDVNILTLEQEFNHLLFQQFTIVHVHHIEFFSLISMVCLDIHCDQASLDISL